MRTPLLRRIFVHRYPCSEVYFATSYQSFNPPSLKVSRGYASGRFTQHEYCFSRKYASGRLTRQESAGLTVPLFIVDFNGCLKKERWSFQDVLHVANMHARDLLALDRPQHTALVAQEMSIVVSLSHARCLLLPDRVLVLHPDYPAVEAFAEMLAQHVESHHVQAYGQTMPPPFELVVLDCIFWSVAQKYGRRVASFAPAIHACLVTMRTGALERHGADVVYRLLPLQNSLSRFESQNRALMECIELMLADEEDMAKMQITAKQGSLTGALELDWHDSVEVLLDTHLRRFKEYQQEVLVLHRSIKATHAVVELELDQYRNRLMQVQMHMSVGAVSCGIASVIAGVFGMNLTSGLESHPNMFFAVAAAAPVVALSLYMGVIRWANSGRALHQDQVAAIDRVAQIAWTLPDMDLILAELERREEAGEDCLFTPVGFRKLLQTTAGTDINDEDLQCVFRVLDSNGDGMLDKGEIAHYAMLGHFVADVHSLRSADDRKWLSWSQPANFRPHSLNNVGLHG